MIGNITKGRGFSGALNYLLDKEKAEQIGGNMIGVTPQELATEFSITEELNDKVERPVYHASLSLPPGQRLSDEQWNEIAIQYLSRMGFTDNQYIVVRHTDTDHDHIHMLASRVKLNGRLVHDGWDYQRSQKMLRELELQYNLEPVQSSWEVERRPLTKGQYEKRRRELAQGIEPEPSAKEQIIKAVDRVMADCSGVEQLSTQLEQMGIEIRLRSKRDGSINGISYRYQSVSVTGYNLGQGYTWAAIGSRLERNHKRQQQESAARIEAERLERVRQQEEEQLRRRESAARLKVQQEQQQQLQEQQHLTSLAAKRSEIQAVAPRPTPEEALELKRMVDSYFQAAPPNCSDSELTTAIDLVDYWSQKVGQVYGELETLTEEVNEANFWQRLQPQHERRMSKLKSLTIKSKQADAQMKEADKRNEDLQLVRQRYKEWEQSPQTQKMRQHSKYLLTPQGQELVAMGVELERQRQMERTREKERRRQMEHTLYKLQQWYKAAQSLNRSPSYLNRIVEVTQEFTTGTPIPDLALTAMIVDLKEQLERRQSTEIEQQRPNRDWDLSR